MCDRHGVSRKSFLTGLVAAAGVALLPDVASAAARIHLPYGTVRQLWVRSATTGAELRGYLTIDGHSVFTGTAQYPGYVQLCELMRDMHVGAVAPMDINVLEALWEIQQVLAIMGHVAPIDITSAFRTQETNDAVGGARFSYHPRAEAVDFDVPGVPLQLVWQVAVSRKIAGGIGLYSAHLHVDTGPRRYWNSDAS